MFFRHIEQNDKTSGSRNSRQFIEKFCTCCCFFFKGWLQKVLSRACFVLVRSTVLYCAPRCYLPSRSIYYDGLFNLVRHKIKPTFRIVSGGDIAGSSSNRSNTPLDWSKCLFRQKDTGKKLVCPANCADRFKGAGYKTIAEALQSFNDIDCLPEDVLLTRMDDGDGLEQTLVSRRAKFHAACSLKFNKSEI